MKPLIISLSEAHGLRHLRRGHPRRPQPEASPLACALAEAPVQSDTFEERLLLTAAGRQSRSRRPSLPKSHFGLGTIWRNGAWFFFNGGGGIFQSTWQAIAAGSVLKTRNDGRALFWCVASG